MRPHVTYAVVTRNRAAHLLCAIRSLLAQRYESLDIVVVDNASTDSTGELFTSKLTDARIRYVRSEENLGVWGGRNLTLQHANGDVVITVDDDVELLDAEATNKVVEQLQEDRSLGALTFRIVDHLTGQLELGAFPSRDKSRDSLRKFETTWFLGGGHAIPKRIYEEIGLYREYFPYGHEDLDLSLRIVDAGYRILYFPKVTLYHKKATTRYTWSQTRLQGINLHNRIKVAIRNLPWFYVLTTDIVRSGQVVIKHSKGNILAVLLAHWYLVRQFPRLLRERTPVRRETIERLKALNGPLAF